MSNKIKFLSQEDVKKCIDMPSAIKAMRSAFAELSKNNVKVPLRTNISLESEGTGALFMPVYYPARKLVGLKSVMINKENPARNLPMIQALYYVFDATTGKPISVMDGEYLTAIRTGAASGLATDLLSAKESEIAVIFGAGVQAEKQIEGITSVRSLRKILISDPNEEKIERLIEKLQSITEAELCKLKDRLELSEADIICTATSSSSPVFESSELKNIVHINGIGSYRPDMCEIPSDVIASAKLYVDERSACLNEAGDIIQPLKKGLISQEHIFAEIGEVILDITLSRNKDDSVTVFKSVGNAVQDIAAASLILENADKLNIGTEINL